MVDSLSLNLSIFKVQGKDFLVKIFVTMN